MVKCNLKWLLAKIDMTQTELAKKVGVSNAYLSKVVRCLSEPTAGLMLRISKETGFKIEDIWELDEDPEE